MEYIWYVFVEGSLSNSKKWFCKKEAQSSYKEFFGWDLALCAKKRGWQEIFCLTRLKNILNLLLKLIILRLEKFYAYQDNTNWKSRQHNLQQCHWIGAQTVFLWLWSFSAKILGNCVTSRWMEDLDGEAPFDDRLAGWQKVPFTFMMNYNYGFYSPKRSASLKRRLELFSRDSNFAIRLLNLCHLATFCVCCECDKVHANSHYFILKHSLVSHWPW